MKRVTGIGGVFFKCKDPEMIRAWYRKHLGIESDQYGCTFRWTDSTSSEIEGTTVWAPFKEESDYFDPSEKPFMINFRVADLDGLMALLQEEGVRIIGEIEEEIYGKFAWILDPEGNKVELWEPVASHQDPNLT